MWVRLHMCVDFCGIQWWRHQMCKRLHSSTDLSVMASDDVGLINHSKKYFDVFSGRFPADRACGRGLLRLRFPRTLTSKIPHTYVLIRRLYRQHRALLMMTSCHTLYTACFVKHACLIVITYSYFGITSIMWQLTSDCACRRRILRSRSAGKRNEASSSFVSS